MRIILPLVSDLVAKETGKEMFTTTLTDRKKTKRHILTIEAIQRKIKI